METPLENQMVVVNQKGGDAFMHAVIVENFTTVGSRLGVGQPSVAKSSFKESLLGVENNTTSPNVPEEELVSDDDEPNGEKDKECPMIRVTCEEKIRMRRLWHQTLIIKVMGRTVGYTYLLCHSNKSFLAS